MSDLKDYIYDFLGRSGAYVLLATVISRVLSFTTSLVTIKLIPNKELGEVLYAWNIILFLFPFIGLGLHQSYIRYGALLKSISNKNILFDYVIKKGIIICFWLTILVNLLGIAFPFNFKYTGTYICFMSLLFIPNFLIEMVKAKFRLNFENKSYAIIDIKLNILLVLLVSLFSYFFKEIGYIIALISAPTIVLLFHLDSFLNIRLRNRPPYPLIDHNFWKFGIFTSLSNVVTTLLFSIDILSIGYFMELSEKITAFKYITLIPYSLFFLPRVFMATDFVSVTENIENKKYVCNYIINYIQLFSIISIVFLGIVAYFGSYILAFFDTSFIIYRETLFIISFGAAGVLILRGLFGNLLSSIGKATSNYLILMTAIFINIVSNYLLIPKLGIKGAAITSAILLWLTGLASCFAFFYHYKKYTNA